MLNCVFKRLPPNHNIKLPDKLFKSVFIGLFVNQIVKGNEVQADMTRDKYQVKALLLCWRLVTFQHYLITAPTEYN